MRTRASVFLFLALLSSLLSSIGCNDDDDNPMAPSSSPGLLFITVRGPLSQIVPGATVSTVPATATHTTGALGTASIPDVTPGIYTVLATSATYGSGTQAVTVESGQVANVTIQLVQGVFLRPSVQIFMPAPAAEFSYEDSVPLSGIVTDDADSPNTLVLEWRSSRDGVLSNAPAGANGSTSFLSPPLSVGEHWITLQAIDSDSLVGTDSVQITIRSFAPEITITSPRPDTTLIPGEPLTFSAQVSDRETAAGNLSVEWRSSIDGILDTAPPDVDGMTEFTSTTLSRGVHEIVLSVVDEDANTTRDTVAVRYNSPQRLVLEPITKDASGVTIRWTPLDEPDFASYRIYRSGPPNGGFPLVDIINDQKTESYRDGSVELGETYAYRVGLLTSEGAESISNTQIVTAGISISIGSQVEMMIADPKRPYIYALDRVNNSLHFVSLDSAQVEKTIYVGSTPTDMDVDASGDTLYIANYGSTEIAVIDLDSREKVRSFFVNPDGVWEGNPYRIACLTQGRLVFTSLDQWNDLKLVDTATGQTLHNTGSIYYPDLVASPDGTRLFIGESGSSGSKLYRYDLVGDQLNLVDQLPGYGIGYAERHVALSGDGNYVFYAGIKFLAANLDSELGTFPGIVYVSNDQGTIAIGEQEIFNGETFSIIRPMPLATKVMSLSADASTLYLYDNDTSRIYLYDISDL